MCIVVGYEYLNSGQARACKRGLIRFSLNRFGTCKRGYSELIPFRNRIRVRGHEKLTFAIFCQLKFEGVY